ncbi:MAG: sensor histidine kinase, partial [Pseudomonadota bacterium]
YASPESFKNDLAQFNKDTLIYVDSELEDGIKGENFAKELFALGLENLYLATGHDASIFADTTCLLGITGKNPPWPNC